MLHLFAVQATQAGRSQGRLCRRSANRDLTAMRQWAQVVATIPRFASVTWERSAVDVSAITRVGSLRWLS